MMLCTSALLVGCSGRVVSATAEDAGGPDPHEQVTENPPQEVSGGTTGGNGGSRVTPGGPGGGPGGGPASFVDSSAPTREGGPIKVDGGFVITDGGVFVDAILAREASFIIDASRDINVNSTEGGAFDANACTVPDVSTKALVVVDVLSDFDGDAPGAIQSVTPGGGWFSFTDIELGTTFTPAPASWMTETPGHGGTGSALHVAGTGFVAPASELNFGAGVGFSLGGSIPGGSVTGNGFVTMPTDVSVYRGISFYAKSSMQSGVKVQFATPDTDFSYCTCLVTNGCSQHGLLVPSLASDWTKYTILFADLHQATNVTPVPFDPTSLLTIEFMANTPVAAFDFWIDDITLIR